MKGIKDLTPDDINLIQKMRAKRLTIGAISWWLDAKMSTIRWAVKTFNIPKGAKK